MSDAVSATPAAGGDSAPAVSETSESTVQSSGESVTNGQPSEADSPPANPFAGTKHKVKLDSEEREVDYDELVRGYQLEQVSRARMEKAAGVLKALETGKGHEILSRLKPEVKQATIRALLDGDDDVANAVEQYIVEQLRFEKMTPEQQEAYLNKQKVQQYERERQERIQSEKQAREQAEQQRYLEYYNTEMPKALQAVGIPLSPQSQARMARYVMHYRSQGQDLPLAKAAEYVAKEYEAEDKARFGGMTGEQLYKALGEETVKKLREYDIKRVSPGRAAPQPPRDASGRFQPEQPKIVRLEQLRAELESKR